MARQFPQNSDTDNQDAGLSLQCIFMRPMIATDKMDSADEGTDIDTWESSGLGLFEFWLDEGWNIDMWKSSGLDLIFTQYM